MVYYNICMRFIVVYGLYRFTYRDRAVFSIRRVAHLGLVSEVIRTVTLWSPIESIQYQEPEHVPNSAVAFPK